MLKSLVLSIVAFAAICPAASATNKLRIRNESKAIVHFVVQQETTTAGKIDRWSRDVDPGDAASVQFSERNTPRLVVAYKLESGGKLSAILAVTFITKDNFAYNDDAVLILKNYDDYYYFEAPVLEGQPQPQEPKKGGVTTLTKQALEKLKKESDEKEFVEEQKKKSAN